MEETIVYENRYFLFHRGALQSALAAPILLHGFVDA
jgi:hypothetical protein